MVQQETRVNVADNTGAKQLLIIKILGGSFHKTATIGDICVCSVKSATTSGMVKKGDATSPIPERKKAISSSSKLFFLKIVRNKTTYSHSIAI